MNPRGLWGTAIAKKAKAEDFKRELSSRLKQMWIMLGSWNDAHCKCSHARTLSEWNRGKLK